MLQEAYCKTFLYKNTLSSPLFVLLQKSHLIDFGAEKLLAFELNISHIVGLRTIDADLASELNPGNSQNTPAKKVLPKILIFTRHHTGILSHLLKNFIERTKMIRCSLAHSRTPLSIYFIFRFPSLIDGNEGT